MNRRTPISAFALITLLSFTSTSQAEEQRHHGVHVHGEALLNLALEGGVLEAELISPAANLVGFEHPPRDAGERERLHRAAEQLKDGARVLGIPAAARCRAEEVEVESALLEEEQRDEAAEHDHGHDDHDHEGERRGEEGAEMEHEGHAEFHVHYHFQCAHPEALERLGMGLFQLFPGIESLRVQAVGPNGQGGALLKAADAEFRF